MRGMATWLRLPAGLGSTFASHVRRRLHPVISADAADAAYWRAVRLRMKGDRRKIVRPLRQAAAGGHAEAATELGRELVLRGRIQEGRAWERRAAELARGQEQPATKLAYYLSRAGEREQAADVLRQAAENGDDIAAYDLGCMLEYAWCGTPWHGQRLAEAQRYFLIASELGHPEAHLCLASMNERGPTGTGQPPG
jgi:TPR repeat protein